MRKLFLSISLIFFLAISGCSKPHSPAQVQQLHSVAADFRHNTLRPNVMATLEDLIAKLDNQWRTMNKDKYVTTKDKLLKERDAALSLLAVTDKDGAIKLFTDCATAIAKLDVQLETANTVNSEKLTIYKKSIIAALNSQFDRSEQADIALIRYEMGIAPSTLDRFLISDATLLPSK